MLARKRCAGAIKKLLLGVMHCRSPNHVYSNFNSDTDPVPYLSMQEKKYISANLRCFVVLSRNKIQPKMKKMRLSDFMGIGPVLMFVGIVSSVGVSIFIALTGISAPLPMPQRKFAMTVGAVLAALGTILCFISILSILRICSSQKLITTGVFGITRNPLYAAIIIFMVPGAALLFNQILFLFVSAAMFVAFKLCIGREERRLLKEFGAEYEQYQRSVAQFAPSVCLLGFCRSRKSKIGKGQPPGQ